MPPEYRDLAERRRAAATDEERGVIDAELRAAVADFVDEEIALLRDRAERKREHVDREVDGRLRRMMREARRDAPAAGEPARDGPPPLP
jgi:hypothetical protein